MHDTAILAWMMLSIKNSFIYIIFISAEKEGERGKKKEEKGKEKKKKE